MENNWDEFSKIIQPSIYHRTIDGSILFEARAKVGVSQAELADRCGHSQQYQQQLEAPGVHEVLTDKANQVFNALVALSAEKHKIREDVIVG